MKKKWIAIAAVAAVAAAAVIICTVGKGGLEIERKWVVDKDAIPYDLSAMERFEITQTYLSYEPEVRVRKIVNGGITYYTKTVKEYVNRGGLVRKEDEWYISESEYAEAVAQGLDSTILKTRYQAEVDGLTYAFDIFDGALEGLAYLEIEFESEAAANAFDEPDWIIKDVTDDRRFKNQELAKHGMPEM